MTVTPDPLPVEPAGPVRSVRGSDLAQRPLALAGARLDARGTLGAWQQLNRSATIPHVVEQLATSGVLRNLRRAAGTDDGDFEGFWFADSDLYKGLEAIGWEQARGSDPAMLGFLDEAVELLTAAQQEDGYLNSYQQVTKPDQKWADLGWSHELYCAGHLIQAAVAVVRSTGDDRLLAIARRFADLAVATFGPAEAKGIDGHPEIETALVELYRETGERSYLDLAVKMLDLRGTGLLTGTPFGSAYYQDHRPIREQTYATGHAVRQLYLAAGVVDAAVETGDAGLLAAAEAVWDDAIATKTYLTGGQGSRHRDESFGDAYELPSDRAYAESCAAIASFMLSWRLLLATGRAKYADEMERLLVNAIPASVSLDGTHFFYSNPLHLRTDHDGSQEDAPSERLSWYKCACCPPNLARLVSSLGAYVATTSGDTFTLQLYAAGRFEVAGDGWAAQLRVVTDYPWDGSVAIAVEASTGTWELALRIPAYAPTVSVRVNGQDAEATVVEGYLHIARKWSVGDTIDLELPVEAGAVVSHPRVDATRGCLAVARGPVVYCVEQHDLPDDVVVDDLRISAVAVAGGRADWSTELACTTWTFEASVAGDLPGVLYPAAAPAPAAERSVSVTAVPYARWANRGPNGMRVWIPAG